MKRPLPTDYGRSYLTAEEFVDLCKNLEIEEVTLDRLEWFEMKRLLIPVRRVLVNPEYAKYMYRVEKDPDNPYFMKPQFELPGEFLEDHRFLERITNWISIWGYGEFFHPLDKKNYRFLQTPANFEFRAWKDYRVAAGQIRGEERFADTAHHFYSYWQALHAWEIMQAMKLQVWVDTSDLETVRMIWQDMWPKNQKGIPAKVIRTMKLPKHYDVTKSIFVLWKVELAGLAFYAELRDRLASIFWVNHEIIDQEHFDLARQFSQRNFSRVARIAAQRYALSQDRLIELLKTLSEKHFEYESDKMYLLAEGLERDIVFLARLLIEGWDMRIEDLKKRAGPSHHYFGMNALDAVVKNVDDEAVEGASYSLKSYFRDTPELTTYFQVDDAEISRFLAFMREHDLDELSAAINEINRGWFSEWKSDRSRALLSLKGITMLPESLIKYILSNSAIEKPDDRFHSELQFKKSLDAYFGHEIWEKTLSKAWRINTKVLPETDIAEKINGKILPAHFDDTAVWDFVIKAFLITGLSRNTAGHHSTKINDLDNATLLIILKNAVYATYVIWKYAQRNQ